jgi:hypothetical protein
LYRQSLTDDLSRRGKTENRQLPNDELQIAANPATILDLDFLTRHLSGFSTTDFFSVGFTHHSEIPAKEKSHEGRFFSIACCSAGFWIVDALKSYLRGDFYAKAEAMSNNFLQTLPEPARASRARMAQP